MTKALLLNIFSCLLLSSTFLLSQDYHSPVDGPLRLSGTFCELRTDHFHTGIDIKASNGNEGDPIYAVYDGYISRIALSRGGYGRVIFIRQADSLVSLYGHLQSFSAELEDYAARYQFDNLLNEYVIDLDAGEFPVTRGQLIGYMGNSGFSFGPHLHFEVRSWDYRIGYNALQYLPYVDDGLCPKIKKIGISAIHPMSQRSIEHVLDLVSDSSCRYHIPEDQLICNASKIGLSILAHDSQEGVPNQNGIYNLRLFIADSLTHEFTMDSTYFAHARHINAHVDYPLWRSTGKRFHKCFMDEWNALRIYTEINLGIALVEHQSVPISIQVSDYFGNSSSLSFELGYSGNYISPSEVYNYKLIRNQGNLINRGPYVIQIPERSLPKDIRAYISSSIDSSAESLSSEILHLHHCQDHLYKPINLTYQVPTDLLDIAPKLCIAQRCSDHFRPLITTFNKTTNQLHTQSWEFGDFKIILDTLPPSIEPIVNSKPLAIKVKDNLWSSSDLEYSASQSGAYVRVYLDAKSGIIKALDQQLSSEDELIIEVSDPLGNTNYFSSTSP